ncbi:MAG: hypothetical protein PHT30_02280 [Bacilli bacterium]|nr:hypothetical protein [Bacilli bacterium]
MDSFDLSDWVNIGLFILTIVTIVIGIFSLKRSRDDNRKMYRFSKIEKAIVLADHYSTLVNDIGFLNSIYNDSSFLYGDLYGKTIDIIPDGEKLPKFTSDEMQRLFEIKNCDDFLSCVADKVMNNRKKFQQAYIFFYGYEQYSRLRFEDYIDENGSSKRGVTKAQIHVFIENVKQTTLNRLEAMSMYFVKGIADDSVIYQSLHQTFIRFVKLMYPFIASLNTDNLHKYYTCIISLYEKWNKCYSQMKRESGEQNMKRELALNAANSEFSQCEESLIDPTKDSFK